MKKFLVGSLALLAFAAAFAIPARSEQPKTNSVRDFMRAKLDHSQKVLEGLALEDFDLIAKNAQALSLLSQAANWQVLQTPEYLRQSQEFRRIADQLTEAAKKKNLDGAGLAYVELTMKCINCHKYVRGVRTAASGTPRTIPSSSKR